MSSLLTNEDVHTCDNDNYRNAGQQDVKLLKKNQRGEHKSRLSQHVRNKCCFDTKVVDILCMAFISKHIWYIQTTSTGVTV